MTNARNPLRNVTCNGCDEPRPTRSYDVTFTDGHAERCDYCDDCAALARMNWNGETAGIRPSEER